MPVTMAALRQTGSPALKLALAGSSTLDHYTYEFSGYTDNPLVTASADGISFSTLGGVGAGLHALGDALVTALGRPLRFLKAAISSTTLAQWEAAGSTQRAALVAGIAAMGGVDAVLVQVGWNDASQGTVTSQAAHATLLRSLYSKIRSETGLASLKVFIGGSQKYNGGGTAGSAQQNQWIRAAEFVVAGDAGNTFACPTYDLAQQGDGIHQTAAACAISGPRWAQAVAAITAGLKPTRGATLLAAAYVNNTTVDVTLAHGSGNDFTPASAITGFDVQQASGGAAVAVSAAVRRDAITVRLTVADVSGAALNVFYADAAAPTTTGVLLDNNYPQALPLDPNIAGVAVAAYAPGAVPTNTGAPAVTSPASRAGQTWTATTGSWTNTPTGYTYQWQRGGTNIAGATAASYLATNADVGAALGCIVTASNASGASASGAASNTTTVLAGLFAFDDFTGTAGTAIASHTGDTGESWTSLIASGLLDGNSGVYESNSSTGMLAVSSFVPTTAEYDVRGTLHCYSNLNESAFLVARATDSNNRVAAGYSTLSSPAGWAVLDVQGGTTVYRNSSSVTLTVGSDYTYLYEIRDARKTLYIGGTKVAEVLTSAVAASNALTAKGSAGVRISPQAGASATAGLHFTSIRISDPGV